jgi:hypothetical protein
MIRLVPDPVVVASAGPLPSATLHETTVSFRHECRNNINDRVRRNNCQEIISGHVVPDAFVRGSLRIAWRTHSSAPTVKAKIAGQEVRLLVDSGTGDCLSIATGSGPGGTTPSRSECFNFHRCWRRDPSKYEDDSGPFRLRTWSSHSSRSLTA